MTTQGIGFQVGSVFLRCTDLPQTLQVLRAVLGPEAELPALGDSPVWAEIPGQVPLFVEQVTHLDAGSAAFSFLVPDVAQTRVRVAELAANLSGGVVAVGELFEVAPQVEGFNISAPWCAELFVHN